MNNTTRKKEIKKIVSGANINFLIGSGASREYLGVLNNIEKDLTDAEEVGDKVRRLELKEEYFSKCMEGNIGLILEENNDEKQLVLDSYKNFYRTVNKMMLDNETSIFTKQVNVFTTNVDVFSEKALEDIGIDFNDGFQGLFKPRYSLSNFKKSYFKKSMHYEKKTEIPVFNILKLHGSLSWVEEEGDIFLNQNLSTAQNVKNSKGSDSFEETYAKLMVVNPTKQKFGDTVLDRKFSDLLRMYSNELEREGSVLFVIGFSFADEHIFSLTEQVANSNPTLRVIIFSHSDEADTLYEELKSKAKNINVDIWYPEEGDRYTLTRVTSLFAEQNEDYNESQDE